MDYWKITNVADKSIKLIVSISSSESKGLLLKKGQFCICMPKQTPVMDAQSRRGLISIYKEFDNSQTQYQLGTAYNVPTPGK